MPGGELPQNPQLPVITLPGGGLPGVAPGTEPIVTVQPVPGPGGAVTVPTTTPTAPGNPSAPTTPATPPTCTTGLGQTLVDGVTPVATGLPVVGPVVQGAGLPNLLYTVTGYCAPPPATAPATMAGMPAMAGG